MRRRNPYDKTTWQEAELAASDALEAGRTAHGGYPTAVVRKVHEIIGQVSDEDLQAMLVELVRSVAPVHQVEAYGPSSEAWNHVHLEFEHDRPHVPPKQLPIVKDELRKKVTASPLLGYMFRDVGTNVPAQGNGYELVFLPAAWLNAQRGAGRPTWRHRRRNPAAEGDMGVMVDETKPTGRGVHRAQRVIGMLSREHMPHAPRFINEPEDAVIALKAYIGNRATEQFVVLYMNVRNKLVGFADYTEGSISGVTVQAGDIIRNALISGAAGFVTAHNHPTGDPSPSSDDRDLWSKVSRLAKEMGMACLDNFVLGADSYYSEIADRTRTYPAALYKEVRP